MVPKNALMIFPSISKESTHKMANAASISLEYVIYAEYIFFLNPDLFYTPSLLLLFFHIVRNIHLLLVFLLWRMLLEIHERESSFFEVNILIFVSRTIY